MEKKVLNVFLLCLIGLFLINFVSADVNLGKPNAVYNLGDEFSIPVSVSSSLDTNDYLSLNLICNNNSLEVFKSPIYLKANQNKNFSLDIKLDQNLISDLSGSCYISSSFASQQSKTQSFEITSRIDVTFLTDNTLFSPNDQVSISGNAIKASGENANGFIVAQVEGLNSSTSSTFSNGAFNLSLVIPSDAPAKSYTLKVKVYEKENESSFSNKGEYSSSIGVRQVVRSVDIAISEISIIPPYNLSARVLLFDQSGEKAEFDSEYLLYMPNSTIYADKKIVKSTDSIDINLESSATPGYWTIEANYGDLSAKKTFFVQESPRVLFTLINQTLTIKNIGNVPYVNTVEIKIGNSTETKELNLALNEEKVFKLSAPDGDYPISVKEGSSSSETSIGSSYLTGRAISVKDISEFAFSDLSIILSWILLVLILLFIAYRVYRSVRNGNFRGRTPSKFSMSEHYSSSNKSRFIPVTKESFPEKRVSEKQDESPAVRRYPRASSSESVAPLRKSLSFETYSPSNIAKDKTQSDDSISNKEEVVVVALKIKNTKKLNDSESPALAVVEHALEKARRAKGKVYDQGDFKLIVFSQRVTQKLDNSLEAIKIAFQIDSILKDFNKKYAIKIDYGLGANVGEMFVEFVDGNVKFTSSGNTTVIAKNAAEKSNKELLITSPLHRKCYNVLKGEQTPYGLYKVNSILDRSSQSQFISKFMKKQEKQ